MYSDHLMASDGGGGRNDSDKFCLIISCRIVEFNCIGCHGYLYKWTE